MIRAMCMSGSRNESDEFNKRIGEIMELVWKPTIIRADLNVKPAI